MFKSEWEDTTTRMHIADDELGNILHDAFPEKMPATYEILSGGCVNLNIKLIFTDSTPPLMLRIYNRDPDAAFREQKIGQLFSNERSSVPVAQTYKVGDCAGYRYAIIEYMSGISLRTLLLHDSPHEWSDLVYDAGLLLTSVQKHTFAKAGFFDKNLDIVKPFAAKGIDDETTAILHNPKIIPLLGEEKVKIILHIFDTHADLLPNASQHHLVHGDFDPSNILVKKDTNRWRISALLDWEFAFSGSYLWDISNFLRYAHKMPDSYQASFLQGLKDAGLQLPDLWEKTTHLLSLVSLLEALGRLDPLLQPKQYKDVCELIDYQIKVLSVDKRC